MISAGLNVQLALQAMSLCGLGDPKNVAGVAKALNDASLPALSLHLLNCLPLVSSHSKHFFSQANLHNCHMALPAAIQPLTLPLLLKWASP